MRKKILLGILAVVAVLGILWVSTMSVISLSVSNPDPSRAVSYSFTDESGKAVNGEITDGSATKIIRKGDYQITIWQGGKSYVAFIQAKGFFRKTTVNASLTPESSRSFVGANPSPCMEYVSEKLLSSSCGAAFEDTRVHRPATDRQPSIVENIVPYNAFGPSEGIVLTKFGPVVLIQSSYSEDEEPGHYASILDDNLQDSGRTRLDGLDPNKTYAMKAYKDGFIAYDTDFEDIYYFTSLSSRPVRITADPPTENSMKPYLIGVSNEVITLAYSNRPADNIADSVDSTENEEDMPAEVAVISGNNSRRFSLKGYFTDVLACGEKKLCLAGSSKLSVYDISGDKAKAEYEVPGAKAIEATGKGLVAVTNQGVLRLDTNLREGFLEYTFGGYDYCGVHPAVSGYVLCVESEKLGKNALAIDQSGKADEPLDKKVLAVSKTPGITFISAYGDYVYIVPDYGDLEYDAASGINRYNPATKQTVNQQISAAVTREGLDKPPYRVFNTGQ